MPPRSQAQREAMHAAAEGHSTLGIPKKVGEEYDEADEGGKLPKKVKKVALVGIEPTSTYTDVRSASPSKGQGLGQNITKEGGVVKRIMRAFKMNEISAVDRPAQAHAKVVLMKRDADCVDPIIDLPAEDIAYLSKRDFDAAQRRSAASHGDALPDGSFPIKTKEDLANARRLVGHSKHPEAARALISRRAKELGVSLDNDRDAKKGLMNIFRGFLEGAKPEELHKTLEAFDLETTMDADEIKKIQDELAITKASLTEVEKELMIVRDELVKAKKDGKDGDGDDDGDDGDGKGKMKKAATITDLPEDIQKALYNAQANEIILKQLMDEREVAEYAKRATRLGLEEMHGETLRKAFSGDKAGIADLEKLMKGMAEQIRTGKIFAEFGAHGSGAGATAADEMKLAADAYREGQIKLGKKCSPQQAFTAIYIDPAHADLKKRYDSEEIKKRLHVA